MVGARYASLEGMEPKDQSDNPQQRVDILEWLKEEM